MHVYWSTSYFGKNLQEPECSAEQESLTTIIIHPLQKELHSRDKKGVIENSVMWNGQQMVAKCRKK